MIKKIKNTSLFLLAIAMVFSACKDDEETNPMGELTINISGLEDLGPDALYEGWMIVDGSPITTGTFSVNSMGEMSSNLFMVNSKDLDDATKFVLTIEPNPDPSPAASSVHILAGDFSGSSANLTIGHESALGSDFSAVEGKYILATPTDTISSNEDSGIWFLDNSSGSPAAGLSLPALPNGWAYEGWAVINGSPVSTGTFTSSTMADHASPFSGSLAGPPFPGEDFLENAPAGLTFPTDIRGGKAVISIEPVPDNSTMPFLLKPLVGDIATNADVHTAIDMGQNLSFPTGSASR
jgi:hypothetical protein